MTRQRDYIIVARPPISVAHIQAAVCDHFGLRMSDMASARRGRDIAHPRQLAMYLAKTMTAKTLPTIGRLFDRDHTTVMHGIRAVDERLRSDAELRGDVAAICERLAA
jgi:chromosomal replication initiator protein